MIFFSTAYPPLTSHSLASHRTNTHSFYYLPLSGHLGFHLISPAQKQQNKIILFFLCLFSLFFALGERSNSLYGWRPLQIRQRTRECVRLDRLPGDSQEDTWQVIKFQFCPCVGGNALGQMETVTVEVYWRPTTIITGLIGRTNGAMGSNYRPLWQLLTTTLAHLHWEHPATNGWPVEDFVSSHTVIFLDSQQKTMVHCTQFMGPLCARRNFALWARGLYSLSTADNRREKLICSLQLIFKCCLFWERIVLFPFLSHID